MPFAEDPRPPGERQHNRGRARRDFDLAARGGRTVMRKGPQGRAPPDRASKIINGDGEVVRVPSVIASSPTTAAGSVMGLLKAGIPLSLLVDLSSRSGPDSTGIYRAELT